MKHKDGLTIINGTKYWFLNGELHRTDGPAVEYAVGEKCWFLNDEELTEQEFRSIMLKEKLDKILIE